MKERAVAGMTRTSRTGRRAVLAAPRRTAVLAAFAALALTGCEQNPPGVAAVVGDQEITDEQVDDLATALCTLNADSPQAESGVSPMKLWRTQALQFLLQDRVVFDLAGGEDLADPERVKAFVEQNEAPLNLLPESEQAAFRSIVEEVGKAQSTLTELGRQSLEDQGETDVDDQAALQEGQRLLDEHAPEAEVVVDPRYGAMVEGQLTAGTGSLSVPVSELAKQGDAATPSADGLPASQICG